MGWHFRGVYWACLVGGPGVYLSRLIFTRLNQSTFNKLSHASYVISSGSLGFGVRLELGLKGLGEIVAPSIPACTFLMGVSGDQFIQNVTYNPRYLSR